MTIAGTPEIVPPPVRVTARGADAAHAIAAGLAAAALVILGIYFGSRHLRDFDVALVPYAGASVFAAFGLGYRYAMWLRRPPTGLYWRRSWQLFFAPRHLPANIVRLARLAFDNFLAQKFIGRRAVKRWLAHWCIFWGCVLAAAVTFPLSFGWIHFETAPASLARYQAFVFGVHVFSFRLDSVLAPLVFNVLDVAALLVLTGIFFALWRRGLDRGALAVQQFANDLLPLALLFAVSVTGLFLTASTHLLRGYDFVFLSQLHAVTVIFTLLYLPFGKFFHIFQRPAQLGIAFYKEAGAASGQATCRRCGAPFASALHVGDLKRVESALGIRYATAAGDYQDVCPRCRRLSVALAQDALWRTHGRGPGKGTR
ncbi:MAG: MFS transporter [Acidobacteriota bacterium]|nr:MFS transporter [Acidobacteriota bacterium]